MAWAHVLQQQSAMGNPFDFRETMSAAFHFTDKTVEQVLADQKARDQARDRENKRGRPTGRKGAAKAPVSSGTPRQAELDKLKALMLMAKPRSPVTDE